MILVLVLIAILSYPVAAESRTCEDWLAKAVSVQGSVQARVKNQKQWVAVQMDNIFCEGDMIRVQDRSRAALVLKNETIIRLDQNTTITFPPEEKKKTSFIDVITGILHFISRVPRTLTVSTPFTNGSVEGTEFLVSVDHERTLFTVFEGQVTASNEIGSVTLTSGQSAIAEAGKAPSDYVIARPRDAVNWALYYPSVISWDSEDLTPSWKSVWQSLGGKSMDAVATGNLTEAFKIIDEIPVDSGDARFFTYRASLLLSVGRVDEARADIERALQLAPGNARSLALQSIIAVVQNDKGKALDLAQKAVDADPGSATAHIALSYALQANFDLGPALSSVAEAVIIEPKNALAWARLAELRLSHRKLDSALEAARKAVEYNPDLARTQSVLGFAHLAQINIKDASASFEEAIKLDQADPLPRLGLGLAKIRRGKLKEGRREIEIAASLDPNNSLVRSYLGKAYYEEKRNRVSEGQYAMAEELDPRDPTPFFYDAIRKQSINRPVEALHDLQKSIELNDNRAVFRSKLLLDDDLAARSASLARIYKDLGFEQLALVEGWNSVSTNPGNYSAHRFLADSYSVLPRHEIARVSELLQSQLLQPLNINPVQPHLAESKLSILDNAGPGDLSFNEFNPLFNRNQIALRLSSVIGEHDTFGDEVTVSGIYNNTSISAGQFHYESDGYRINNDFEEDVYNVFTQVRLSQKTSILAEFRSSETEKGDLTLNFFKDFPPNVREDEDTRSIRLGLRHTITPQSDIIAVFTYRDRDASLKDNVLISIPEISIVPCPPMVPPPCFGVVLVDTPADFIIEQDNDGYLTEIQHLYRSQYFNVTTGASYFSSHDSEIQTLGPALPDVTDVDNTHTNFYIYSQVMYPTNVVWTIGANADFLDDGNYKDQINPKLGVTVKLPTDTTLRAAVFRVLKRTILSNQTLEPTQVAGFNQFFDDSNATDVWRYGAAIDQKFSDYLYGGIEFSERDLEVLFTAVSTASPGAPPELGEVDWNEQFGRAYLYWMPHRWVALSAEYQYEEFDRDEEFFAGIKEVKTHSFPLGINFHHTSGFSAKLKATYRDQDGNFKPRDEPLSSGSDTFWIVDAGISFRLPKRYGIITLEAKNLFDKEFNFQDTDPVNPRIQPKRTVLFKFTLAL